jgi:hypothetical protein
MEFLLVVNGVGEFVWVAGAQEWDASRVEVSGGEGVAERGPPVAGGAQPDSQRSPNVCSIVLAVASLSGSASFISPPVADTAAMRGAWMRRVAVKLQFV